MLKSLLENLQPVHLESLACSERLGISINGIDIQLCHNYHPKCVGLFMDMVYLLLTQTCLSRNITVPVMPQLHNSDKNVNIVSEKLQTIAEVLNSNPPSLTKVSILAIRENVLKHGNPSNIEKLGLPKRMTSMLRWEALREELCQMWGEFDDNKEPIYDWLGERLPLGYRHYLSQRGEMIALDRP